VKFMNKRLIFKNIMLGNCGYCGNMGLEKINVWELTKLHYVSWFGFMPLDQIVEMSLNGLSRRVETHNKNQNETRINEPSLQLDLGH